MVERSWVLPSCYQVAVCPLWNTVLFGVEVRGNLLLIVDWIIKNNCFSSLLGISTGTPTYGRDTFLFLLTSGLPMELVFGWWKMNRSDIHHKAVGATCIKQVLLIFLCPKKNRCQIKPVSFARFQNEEDTCSQPKSDIMKVEKYIFVLVK